MELETTRGHGDPANLYSIEAATGFEWASLTGNLQPERVQLLEHHVIGPRVLDAGCGGGAYVDYLTRKGFDVTGLEMHDAFLNTVVEKRFAGSFVQGDVTALPFADKSFDTALCFDVLEHVDDVSALRELARVASQRIILTVPKRDDLLGGYGMTFAQYRDRTHLRYYTEQVLRDLVQTIECFRVSVFPEVPLPVKRFVKAMLVSEKSNLWLQWSYRRARTHFLLWLLERSGFRVIHTGLAAVIDLQPRVRDPHQDSG